MVPNSLVKIEINYSLLSDSPRSSFNRGLFTVPFPLANDFLEDMRFGTPTCYLISGYRGAGKTSFINQIEEKMTDVGSKSQNKGQEVVFVHSNFSDYQTQTYLLRKLIRGLYLELKDLKSYKDLKKIEEGKSIEERTTKIIEELYEKTFFDTSHNFSISDKTESVTVVNIDIKLLLKTILPCISFILFAFNLKYSFVSANTFANIVVLLISAWKGIEGAIEVKRNWSKQKTENKEFTRKSLYDNEIADYHFFRLLKSLKDKYKIIFVLDELDKVAADDVDKLLKEMKPYLVSGCASFIAVAGQNLFYKYVHAKSLDDSILSSIFSRFVHVPLFSRQDLKNLFDELIVNKPQFNQQEQKYLDSFIDSLIFESKKVPRKFISLVRQNLNWENDKAFIEITKAETELNKFTVILNIIDKIEDEEIETEGFEDGLHDYFVMQLFINSHKILFPKKQEFSRNEIMTEDGEQ